MREIEKISDALFEKIRTRFENLSLGDEKANATTDPEQARFFNFDFISASGANLGNITISLIDNDSLKIYYGQNITDNIDRVDEEEWFEFLRGLKNFARRNMLQFDTRDITRSNLNLDAIKQQSKSDNTYDTDEISVSESVENVICESMYGSRINSYENRGPVKIRIKHSDFIDPEKRGARSHKIESVYLETHRGERFLLDHNNLHYARAMARHLSEGGVMHDDLGQHLTGIIAEMAAMKHFVAGARRRQFEDRETQEMVQSALNHYSQQKDLLKRLRKSKDYKDYTESYIPENAIENDVNIDALRERFVKKIYDDRFDEALPYVYRAYQREQAIRETELANEFAAWADTITEETWNTPDTDEEIDHLHELMGSPITAGIDGMDASSVLNDAGFGSDELNELFRNFAQEQGPDADVRPLIVQWLEENNPELAAQFQTAMQPPEAPQAPEQSPVPNQEVAATTMDEPVVEALRRLAGLAKK